LTVRFGGLAALNSVNFEVGRDEIRAIIGPNGAGKSTFFNCLTGVLRPSSGRILFKGEDITGLSADRISRKGIARSYQITNILPNATALENVRIAAQSRRHGWSMLTHYGAYGDIIAKAEAVLESVGLRGKAQEFRLSGERNPDLKIALLAMRQICGQLLSLAAQADRFQHGLSFCNDVAIGGVMGEHAPAVPARLGCDTDIFQRGGVRQNVGDLVGTRDALARDAIAGQPRDVLALEQDAACRGPQNTGQAIEEGAFARPVRPDDGADFITPDLEVDATERGQAAEADCQQLCPEKGS